MDTTTSHTPQTGATTITEHEMQQVERANATGRQPVVFVHGLWLLPSSWNRWATLFEQAGYTALTPGWPDDPDTVEEANANPEVMAHKTVGQVADHFEQIVCGLDRKPAILGHSFGGLRATYSSCATKKPSIPTKIAGNSAPAFSHAKTL